MNARTRRAAFLTDLLTVGGAGEAFGIHLVRRDGFHLGGYGRPALADLLEKHFPGAGRATKKPRAAQRRRPERKK